MYVFCNRTHSQKPLFLHKKKFHPILHRQWHSLSLPSVLPSPDWIEFLNTNLWEMNSYLERKTKPAKFLIFTIIFFTNEIGWNNYYPARHIFCMKHHKTFQLTMIDHFWRFWMCLHSGLHSILHSSLHSSLHSDKTYYLSGFFDKSSMTILNGIYTGDEIIYVTKRFSNNNSEVEIGPKEMPMLSRAPLS